MACAATFARADADGEGLARAGPLAPDAALASFRVAGDLELDLLLHEPLVAQPVSLSFDERGRLWVVQYRQYPHPAGLRMLSHDRFWRAVYDRVPEPPPRHTPGADRITIHTDTDGDGRYDGAKTFADGLNIVTAVEFGRGGVWVLNPPYLLFYPDLDRDDVPDADPHVHLAGFGLEDTHSVVNSLTWGPDGWLYGAQGSTVTARVGRPGMDREPRRSMGQLIWRYHPESRRYEVFAEGGGNAFGVEIDRHGRVFSGHNGGGTRGFHYLQGAYLQKGFAKHGPLSNPYAFGYFPAMPHHEVERFTHTFVIDEGGALPDPYRGKLFGAAPLQGHIVLSEIEAAGSTFRTRDVGHPLAAADPWFRPVAIELGPDGALYIADWYDAQVNHYRNHEGEIDVTTGRVYRLRARGALPARPFDLAELDGARLIALLEHENRWMRRTALRVLADRRDRSLRASLAERLAGATGPVAVELLWALNACGGFDEPAARVLLDHEDPLVRLWTVRLLGDACGVEEATARKLAYRAGREESIEVRAQMASTARRLPVRDGLPVVLALLARNEDRDDPCQPLLLWWALETFFTSDDEAVLAAFAEAVDWRGSLVREHVLGRLLRRAAAELRRGDLVRSARLFALAPDADTRRLLAGAFEEAVRGRVLAGVPPELARALDETGGVSLELAARLGRPGAVATVLGRLEDGARPLDARIADVQLVTDLGDPRTVDALLPLLDGAGDPALRHAVLTGLARFDADLIAARVITLYPSFPPLLRRAATALLFSRERWAASFLEALSTGRLDPGGVPLDAVEQVRASRPALGEQLDRLFGERLAAAVALDPVSEAARLEEFALSGEGDPYRGKELYGVQCARCHRLFGEGGDVGPDLTDYQRQDVANLLLAVLAPSAEIRAGFEPVLAITAGGRTVAGFVVEESAAFVSLRGGEGETVVIARPELLSLAPAGVSIMPQGLLGDLSDAEVRDLLAYLRSTQPLNE